MPAPIHKTQPQLLAPRTDDGFVKCHEAVSDYGRPLVVREPYGIGRQSPEAAQALLDRCDALTLIRSPRLASVSLAESSEGLWVVEDRRDAIRLSELLAARQEQGTPLPPPLVLALGIGIAQALDDLHRTEVGPKLAPPLHLALCPDHVLIQRGGQIALCGYALGPDPVIANPRNQDHPVGLLAYASPEQTYAGQRCSPATDLFALGSILVEVLEGESPFRGPNRLETLQRVRLARAEACAYTFGRGLPMFADVLSRLLMVHPSQRWATPARFLEALGVEEDTRSLDELATAVSPLFVDDPYAAEPSPDSREGLELVVAPKPPASRVAPVNLRPPSPLDHEE